MNGLDPNGDLAAGHTIDDAITEAFLGFGLSLHWAAHVLDMMQPERLLRDAAAFIGAPRRGVVWFKRTAGSQFLRRANEFSGEIEVAR